MAGIFQIDPSRGKRLFAKELLRQHTVQDRMAFASLLSTYGMQLLFSGDPQNLDESIQLLTEALELWRKLNVKWGRAGSIPRTCLYLGIAHTYKGEPAMAMEYEREAIQCYREVGDVNGVAWAQVSLGWPALAQGNLTLAKTSFRASLKLSPDGDMSSVPYALAGLAETLRQQGNLMCAGRLYGATWRFNEQKNPPYALIKNLPTMQAVHTYLHNPAFAAAWSEGKTMSLAEVMRYALE
jgi:tetratricopeptide (TPR) repeat protein